MDDVGFHRIAVGRPHQGLGCHVDDKFRPRSGACVEYGSSTGAQIDTAIVPAHVAGERKEAWLRWWIQRQAKYLGAQALQP